MEREAWGVVHGALGPSREARERLQRAVERAARVVGRERVLVVVLEQDQPWWSSVLADLPAQNVIAQPLDRGTGTGVLAALALITARTPAAAVLLTSIQAPGFEEQLLPAAERILRGPLDDEIVMLLGARTERDQRASRSPSLLKLNGLLHEPSTTARQTLLAQGALLASSFVVGTVRALVGMYRAAQPRSCERFLAAARQAAAQSALDALYPFATALDFEQHVLTAAISQLWVQAVDAQAVADRPEHMLLTPRPRPKQTSTGGLSASL